MTLSLSAAAQANLRRFLDLIQHKQVDKVLKLLERGFDPNYHDEETGGKTEDQDVCESPLGSGSD